jgi:peptidoglycan/LPS O-acetylase OafA/YrhL
MARSIHPGAAAAVTPAHADNFAFLRMLAALMVLVSHQYELTGRPLRDVLGLHSVGGMGVVIFFSISGFLVAQSWRADPHVGRFAARRLLRVWPGYAAAIVVSALVIGPLVTSLPLREYVTHPAFSDYLRNLWFQLRGALPLSFEGSKLPFAVNGSLWTIPLELKCYVVLALLGLAGVLRQRALLVLVTLAVAVVHAGWQLRGERWMAGGMRIEDLYLIEFGACFLVGATLNGWWPLLARHKLAGCVLAAGVLAPLAWFAGRPVLAMVIAVPMLVIAFGSAAWPVLRRFDRFGDLSYGTYLYAFPVQQTLIWGLTDHLHWWPRLLVTVLTTLACALLSWHLIEKQALRWKPRRPRTSDAVSRATVQVAVEPTR